MVLMVRIQRINTPELLNMVFEYTRRLDLSVAGNAHPRPNAHYDTSASAQDLLCTLYC
jgi:hypothetical protein